MSCGGGGGGGVLRALCEVDGAGVFAGALLAFGPGAGAAPPAWSGGGAGVEAGCCALSEAGLFCGWLLWHPPTKSSPVRAKGRRKAKTLFDLITQTIMPH
jgi:hypothetical protein